MTLPPGMNEWEKIVRFCALAHRALILDPDVSRPTAHIPVEQAPKGGPVRYVTLCGRKALPDDWNVVLRADHAMEFARACGVCLRVGDSRGG